MIHKNRQNRRVMRRKHIKRKIGILKRTDYCWAFYILPNKRRIGQLAKGKIHCSCPDCSPKCKRDHTGARNRGDSTYRISDRRKLQSARDAMLNYKDDIIED